MDHSPPPPISLNSPPPPPPPTHGHYAVHDRVAFGAELRKRSEGPIETFGDKLVEYGYSPVEVSQHFELAGPSTEKECCDVLNSIMPKCM